VLGLSEDEAELMRFDEIFPVFEEEVIRVVNEIMADPSSVALRIGALGVTHHAGVSVTSALKNLLAEVKESRCPGWKE
jgi:hypothetical protein